MSSRLMDSELFEGSVVLTLTINNSEPIEVGAFARAFTSLASEYKDILEKKGLDSGAEVYVKQVRSGSIVADLIPMVVTAFPVVVSHAQQIDQAVDFVEKWGGRISSLASGIVPEGVVKSDFKVWAGAVEAIARDPNATSTLEVATFEDGERKVKASFTFNTREAKRVERTIEGEYKRLEQERDRVYYRQIMYFTRSDISDVPLDKRSGERAMVPEIYASSLPVIYASARAEERIKYEIRETPENIFKKGFSIDVSVQYRGDRPVAYKIIEVHQTFDLPDGGDLEM